MRILISSALYKKTALRSALFAVAWGLLCPGTPSAHAKRPELDAVFWGNLTHDGGQALRPAYVGEITVSAWLDGVKIAELAVPPSANPNPSRYVLKIPMDDGAAPRIPGTARGGERVKIRVRNQTTEQEYEGNETESSAGLSLPTTKGTVTPQNLSLDEDLSGASPILARFAVWRAQISFQPDILDTEADTDGDGMSNFAEFLSDTDPMSGSSALRIQQVRHAGTVNSIRFGPIRPSRVYVVHASRTMLPGDWQQVATITPAAEAEFHWHDHVAPDPNFFYRVEVKIQ